MKHLRECSQAGPGDPKWYVGLALLVVYVVLMLALSMFAIRGGAEKSSGHPLPTEVDFPASDQEGVRHDR